MALTTNDKNLNSEIETKASKGNTLTSGKRSTNDKNLNSEIETTTGELADLAVGDLPMIRISILRLKPNIDTAPLDALPNSTNDKNLNSEIETCRGLSICSTPAIYQ